MIDEIKSNEEMDVRVLVPIEQHKKLVALFGALPQAKPLFSSTTMTLYHYTMSSSPFMTMLVGWEYLNRGGREWKVKVTRTEASEARE